MTLHAPSSPVGTLHQNSSPLSKPRVSSNKERWGDKLAGEELRHDPHWARSSPSSEPQPVLCGFHSVSNVVECSPAVVTSRTAKVLVDGVSISLAPAAVEGDWVWVHHDDVGASGVIGKVVIFAVERQRSWMVAIYLIDLGACLARSVGSGLLAIRLVGDVPTQKVGSVSESFDLLLNKGEVGVR